MIGPTTYAPPPSVSPVSGSTAMTAEKTQDVAASDHTGYAASTNKAGAVGSLSNLARQLSEAAAHAQARDSNLGHKERADKAAALLDQITGEPYFKHQAKHDAEVPDTSDPELLARAEQATRFVNGTGNNPFEGMPRDQLSLIAHDDSGTFTVNERRAAWLESDNQRQLWQQHATAKGMDEESQASKMGDVQSADTLTAAADTKNTSTVQTINETSRTQNPRETESYKLMVARLFGGREPPVANGAEGMNIYNITRRPHEFLTDSDRILLADIYAYAQEEGADLQYVDAIASRLGSYRQQNNGQIMGSFNNGTNYDSQGRQLTVDFNEKDAATASRILNSSARYTTQIDHGFLSHILDPGFGALSHTSDFEFLEHIVNKLSSENIEQEPLANKFGDYKPVGVITDHIVFTANENVRLEPIEPDIVKVNGVYMLTEKGKAAGITIDEVHGRTPRHSKASLNQEMNRYILEAFFGKNDEPQKPSSLMELLKQPDKR